VRLRRPSSLPARLAAALAVLLLGAVTCVFATVLHPRWWGLALGVVATTATLVALPGGWWSRLPFAVGFVAVLALLTSSRPEGDYLVASNLNGYLLLGFGLVVLLGGIVGLRARPGAPEDAGSLEGAP
jgi:hypothetical protein